MIARSPSLPKPIPFADPLHESAAMVSRAVRWSPPPPLKPAPHSIHQGRHSLMPMRAMVRTSPSANDASPAPSAKPALVQACPPVQQRQAKARYDGPNALCVRSSATGRHYRFAHTGAIEVIDAADIALMRRIEEITVL